jgi:hypothetical protein
MKVKTTGQISGSRDGVEWPPAGSEIDLPQDEALSLINSGMARPVGRVSEAETAVVLDPATEARVKAATTTRERASRSKRAHEPLNLGAADENQPAEDDNGPRLPEVNAGESARVEDPATPTQSEEGPTGETKAPSEGSARSAKK